MDPVDPTGYTYGSDCATLTDEFCADVAGCSKCSWSWPSNDPLQWSSADAACRCQDQGTVDPAPADYTYGSDCATLTDEFCADVDGCTICAWSWPSSDPLQWDSTDAACRCKEGPPAPELEKVY